jgi:hypothetical protein
MRPGSLEAHQARRSLSVRGPPGETSRSTSTGTADLRQRRLIEVVREIVR